MEAFAAALSELLLLLSPPDLEVDASVLVSLCDCSREAVVLSSDEAEVVVVSSVVVVVFSVVVVVASVVVVVSSVVVVVSSVVVTVVSEVVCAVLSASVTVVAVVAAVLSELIFSPHAVILRHRHSDSTAAAILFFISTPRFSQ